MNKVKIYENISDYIDQNMTETELKSFEEILSNDRELKQKVQDIQSLLKNVKKISPLKLPNSFDIKLKESIEAIGSKKFKIFDNPIFVTFGSIMAAMLLVVTTTIFFSNQLNDKSYSASDNLAYDLEDQNMDYEAEGYLDLNIELPVDRVKKTSDDEIDW